MLVVSDNARDSLSRILASEHATGKSLIIYLQGAG